MVVYCCVTCGCSVQESEAHWYENEVYCSCKCVPDSEVETFECQACGELSENWWSCDHCGHDDLNSVG